MTASRPPQQLPPDAPARPVRKRRWLRRILAGLAALVVFIVAAVAVTIKLQSAPAPLALPEPAAAPVGPLDGAWRMASGSVAGFRIQQTVLGLTSDVVGRTEDVTGTVMIAGSQVVTADVRVNLLTLTSGGKPAPQFANSLDTRKYPAATLSLARPLALGAPFASGATTTVTAAAQLTLHGVTRTVTVPLSLHRDAATVEAAGTIPVSFSDWDITRPQGYGSLGSLAPGGVAEFLLVLSHS
jgi:polyisoprenoid-binding protein YceI